MAQSKHVASLRTLRTANVESQVSILRMIKNDIAGHELRKREYVQEGLILHVSQLLQRATSLHNPPNDSETDYDKLWAQAADVITVIAHGSNS
jgi:hypothetical protein